jgi:hypothetical protein
MSLQSRLNAIVTRIGAEIKGVRTLVNGNAANLNSLSTTNKTDLVAAINEVNARTAYSLALTRLNPVIATDCATPNASGLGPFFGSAIGAGTLTSPAAGSVDANRPGVVSLRSSATANSGYRVGFDTLLLGKLSAFEAIWQLRTFSGTTVRAGFHDATSIADAVDGVYFEVSNAVVTPKTASNSVRSSGTTFNMSSAAWYRFQVMVNAGGTLATFNIFDATNALLFTTTLSTNIPVASARETNAAIIATSSGTSAAELALLDFIGFSQEGLVR